MELNWYKSSLILTKELRSVLVKMKCGDVLLETISESNGTSYIFPINTNIFIADEERVRGSKNFLEILKYYETKVEPSESEAIVLIAADDTPEEIQFTTNLAIDRRLSILFKQVYLDLQGISSISDFPYSIIHKICDVAKNNKGHLSFLLEFISLCALSTRVVYDDSSNKYGFQIGSKIDSEFQKCIRLDIAWNDAAFFMSNVFSTITMWVLDDTGIPNGQLLRRSVAQNYVLGFEESSGILTKTQEEIRDIPKTLDNMFESVINARSEMFIQKINKMKEEYIDSFNQYSQMMTSTNAQVVSNIFAITAAIYGIFLTRQSFESPVSYESYKVLIIFFLITTGIIAANFVGNLVIINKSRRDRRQFCSEMLGVTNENLATLYDKINGKLPYTWLIPAIVLGLIIVALVILLNVPRDKIPELIKGLFI